MEVSKSLYIKEISKITQSIYFNCQKVLKVLYIKGKWHFFYILEAL